MKKVTVTMDEFYQMLDAQGVDSRQDNAFVCPMCGTIQTAKDLINAGAGETFEEVQGYLGFSCVGRFTGAESPRKNRDGKPCNWTLGGLFQFHEFEVKDEKGQMHPLFRPATAEEMREKLES